MCAFTENNDWKIHDSWRYQCWCCYCCCRVTYEISLKKNISLVSCVCNVLGLAIYFFVEFNIPGSENNTSEDTPRRDKGALCVCAVLKFCKSRSISLKTCHRRRYGNPMCVTWKFFRSHKKKNNRVEILNKTRLALDSRRLALLQWNIGRS